MQDDPLKAARDSVSLVSEVIKAAGESTQVKEAASNLGQTAVTLTQAINNALLPLAAINFACNKARTYFSGKFQQDIAEKTAAIPPEHIIEPKASIAGPTLQGLAFTHEEPNLKEMYLSLLATSMDGRAASVAHPAFVEIIKQLDSEDARLVRNVLQSEDAVPIVQIRRINANSTFSILVPHIFDLKNTAGIRVENPMTSAMIDNWIRLGLVEIRYDVWLDEPFSYSWVELRPEYIRFAGSSLVDKEEVTYQRGGLMRTELGKRFAAAVGLLS
ncbi:DUF4393 domain-containing protein [Leeia aquatica]|uniref:DUF4393 domain-containing protein n=1 Tax=Leeia aquatica TaxID=2725557 RepID=A0A847SEL3_9NEIS|nr:DUF4393 domain-containing protein [Leeia aquatica]NLR74392.1 DUF4393 domain-containing protein [Leeia aquatica]